MTKKKLSAQQMKAIEMMADDVKKTYTQQQIADKLGITRSTLWAWRKQPEFQQELQQAVRRNVRERLPRLFDKAIEHAENGNAAALGHILKSVGMFEQDVEVAPKESSEDKIDAIREKLREIEAERK